MKRLLAFMLAVLMIFTCAYADNGGSARYEKYKISLSAKLNKPIMMFGNDEGSSFGKTMLNGIFDSKFDIEISANSPDGMLETEVFANLVWSIPVEFSKALKLTASGNSNFWLDMNLNEISDGKYLFIMENPFDTEKYIYGDLLKDNDFGDVFENVTTSKDLSEVSDEVKQIIKDNCTIKAFMNKKTVEITDEQLKNIITEFVDGEYIKLPEESSVVADRLKNVTLLGKDGIKAEITEKSGGVKNYDISANIAFNAYDLSVNLFDDDSVGYDRENSDVDFTVFLKCEKQTLNKPVEIKFPELTEENSTDFDNPFPSDHDRRYDEYEERWIPDEFYINISVENSAENFGGVDYFPVRSVFDEMNLYDDVVVNDGEISCSNEYSSGYKSVKFKEFSKTVILDGKSYEMPLPVLEKDGTAYVPILFFTDTLGGTYTGKTVSRYYDYENNTTDDYTLYEFTYPNPYYIN